MILSDLSKSALTERLRGSGLHLPIGQFLFRIQTRLPELVDPIHLLYGDFPVSDGEGIVDFRLRVDRPRSLRRWVAPQVVTLVDGQRCFLPFPRRLALPMLEWSINWCIYSRPNNYLILHSAVVERDGKAIVIPGHTAVLSGELEERLVRFGRAAGLVREVHQLHIVHRDIKPANFLTNTAGRIHLADFGLAKLMDDSVYDLPNFGGNVTQSGFAMGTT